MQESLRIGTLVRGGEAVQVIPQMVKHGFESFQLNFWQTIGDTDLAETAARIQELALKHHFVISAVGIYGNPLGGNPESGDTLAGWEQLIEHAHLFGTDIVGGFTGRLPGSSIDESLPRFAEVFGELAKKAADKGLRIAFENCAMGGSWQKGDWNIAHNPTAWEKMFNAVNADNLGLEWEPAHQLTALIDPVPQLRKWVDKIFHVHGKDATIAWDIIKEYGIHGPKPYVWDRTPGFGDTNWTDIISILRQGGYQGTIDIEGWHDPVYRDELEMTGQVHALNYLKNCRGGSFVPNPVI